MSAPLSADASTSGPRHAPRILDIDDDSESHDGSTPPGADAPHGAQSPVPADTSQESLPPNRDVGNDEPAGVEQDAASRPTSPQPVVSRTGVLNFDDVVRHVRAGNLPSRDQSSPGIQNTPPARFTLPPPRNLVGESFIVGIPAHALAYRNGAYVREGYGGVEALMLFDGLSEPDMQDLCALVGDPAEVREMVLRPYRDQPTPILDSLETTWGSLMARREFASLVTHFSPFQLAQRTFYTVSLLHRVLTRDRQREHVLQGMDENSVARRLLQLQSEHDRLKEDFVFLYGYHEQETQSVRDEASHTQGVLEADFARLARENLEETAALRQRNDDLESQLRYAQSQISTLEQRVRDRRFDADGLLAFLNTGTNEVRGNWPRFRKLLGQFQRGVAAPPSWKTWITVEAADKSFRMIPPYPGPAPPDSDENDDDMEQEEKSEDNPPSPDSKRDVPRGKTPRRKEPRKSQSGSKRRASSQPRVDVEVQCRPTVHPESDVGPRPSSEALPFTIGDACALLPEFIAWEDLRPDVQWAMRTGLGYDEAVETMLADAAQHSLFHRDSLCDMLATMMYHHRLDDTPWARYVPTAYYVMAEVVLENWLGRGVVPSQWPDLHNLTDDLPEVIESSSSEEVDDPEDPDFAGPSPKEEEVDPPQTKSDDAGTSPPDSEALVLRSKRKVPVQRVYSSSDSSESSAETTTKALVYSPSPKRPRHSRSGTKSGKKSGSLRARARSSLDRMRSFLARKSYGELSPAELAMIEVPDPNISSWRRRGILTQYTPRKGDHEYQTAGFPDYSPQKTEIRYLAQRWTPFEGAYITFRAKKPWKTMFRSRVKELYFHRRADLDAKVWDLLDEYLEYVRDHAEAFWEVLHWFTIKYKPERDEEDDDLDKYSVSAKLYRERAARHESVGRSMEARIRKYISKGVPVSLFEEPGVWKYPVKICHLYLADKSTLNAAGNPLSLEEQIILAEQAEPSRTQWTKYCTDAERIAHVVPKELQQKLLSPEERKKNPVSLTL